MDGIHDLGGRAGLGPIKPESDEPVFHSDWERSVLTMFPAMALAGAFNLDQFRGAMEQIPPHDYLTSQYYEHWMHAMIHHGIEAGIFDSDELDRRTQYYMDHPDETTPTRQDPQLVETISQLITHGADYRRPTDTEAAFAVGDKVIVRSDASPNTHTRRAGYVRGRVGEVVATHGAYVFPDTNALGAGESPEHLYTVRFSATELWGEPAAPNVVNHIDVFEPYLLPA
ncbi:MULTISPECIES: nitrile hydratase subunit beta [Rhodococcus]|uniref:Nitrile hydratase subunit beta n=1 Tax=Rhodococcus aetherivorans TaxID=191292 RepID=A0AA46PU12_9NOCA|nr:MULTISPECIES: nitrile hydratase subunit beta [Rhodococcus]MCZ1074816.1 nitrile hydratase subunit beta [Rhodococcus sp. A5(2022)]UYF97297.1 nitrile hydratase subunit beta [Rhodococcus aetherivorans]WAL49424.1 nitrile hydratase subunit beta [Rhodococcus pyridinivorans]